MEEPRQGIPFGPAAHTMEEFLRILETNHGNTPNLLDGVTILDAPHQVSDACSYAPSVCLLVACVCTDTQRYLVLVRCCANTGAASSSVWQARLPATTTPHWHLRPTRRQTLPQPCRKLGRRCSKVCRCSHSVGIRQQRQAGRRRCCCCLHHPTRP